MHPGAAQNTQEHQGILEREGLEPAEGLSQINKLRISLKIRTPDLPSKARIWHSIWHWTNSVSCELLVPSHVAIAAHLYRYRSLNELQPNAPGSSILAICDSLHQYATSRACVNRPVSAESGLSDL